MNAETLPELLGPVWGENKEREERERGGRKRRKERRITEVYRISK